MDQTTPGVSIVVPVFNERENLALLLTRIDAALRKVTPYELVIVDDHSTDGSWELLTSLTSLYPLRLYRKQGARGKAESLRQGFAQCQYSAIAFIDADLQYPPEALPAMLAKLSQADMVVTERVVWQGVPWLRRVLSQLFRRVTVGGVLGLPHDVQSGLKIFRSTLLPYTAAATNGWNFDAAFLWQVARAGKIIVSEPITFYPRTAGTSKIHLLSAGFSLLGNVVKLRWQGVPRASGARQDLPDTGFTYNGQVYVPYTKLPLAQSAFHTITLPQIVWLVALLSVLASGLLFEWRSTVVAIIFLLSLFYLTDIIYMLFLAVKSLVNSPEIAITEPTVSALQESELPIYSILCPLYREAAVVEQFVEAIGTLDWPKDKLDVQLLLEEDDIETRSKVDGVNLPAWMRTTVVPAGNPRTKPKACNYGLLNAKGEYVVIFDAEDVPEPDQLKKVFAAFQILPEKVVCVQAKLSFYNANQNFLTRLFAAEYYLWFGLILPGLQSLDAPLPLGGTSNHFKLSVLKNLHGWDPFNVTEDCDLGMRLFRGGYRTAMIDSTTYEEANSHLGNWLRQRSRWIKGYLQTYLVTLRHPRAMSEQGLGQFISFHLTVGGKALSLFINPLFWLLTLGYILARTTFQPVVDTLYPPALVYLGGVGLVLGNFLYFYSHMLAVAKTRQWWLVKYIYFVPIYWLLMSLAGWYAFWQLITRPHYWEKTRHGLHMSRQGAWFDWLRARSLLRQRA